MKQICKINSKGKAGRIKPTCERTLKSAALILVLIAAMLSTTTDAYAGDDRTMCNLKGNVQKVVYDGDIQECPIECETLTFNRDGSLRTIDSYTKAQYYSYGYKKDAQGRLWKIPGVGEDTFTYNAQGYLDKIVMREYGEIGFVHKFTYTADGKLMKLVYTEYDGKKIYSQTTFQYIYSNSDIDAHGNWTKRIQRCSDGTNEVQTRTITYWK